MRLGLKSTAELKSFDLSSSILSTRNPMDEKCDTSERESLLSEATRQEEGSSSSCDGDDLSFDSELPFTHYWRFSAIMGFCDVLSDVDKYFSYLFLIQTHGCDFEAQFGFLSLIYTTVYMAYSPIAGVVADLLEKQILLWMAIFSAALAATYGIIIASRPGVEQLLAMYLLRSILHVQLSSFSWKAIKMFVEGHLRPSPLLHEAAMNKIGTLGDLSTGTLEIVLVACCMASGVWLEDYDLVYGLMCAGVLGVTLTVFIISASLVVGYGLSLPESKGELLNSIRRESITSVAATASDNKEALHEMWKYLRRRFDYFFGSVVLTNCASLSMVSSCFEYMFDGPVTLTRAALSQTHHGMCDGAVDFILMQALMLEVFYLLGGSIYFSWIMQMHPRDFYGRAFPCMSALFMLATVTPFLTIGEVGAAAVISIITVVSYYTSIYNSYVLSGEARAEYFGFVQGMYSIAVGVAGLVPALLQILQASQAVLMGVAIVMATWGLLQSLHLWGREYAASGHH